MDTNSGDPWSEMDVWELKNSVVYGRSFAEVAGFHIVMDVAKRADKEMTDLGHGLVHTAKARHVRRSEAVAHHLHAVDGGLHQAPISAANRMNGIDVA